jgi:hypothetical protein
MGYDVDTYMAGLTSLEGSEAVIIDGHYLTHQGRSYIPCPPSYHFAALLPAFHPYLAVRNGESGMGIQPSESPAIVLWD